MSAANAAARAAIALTARHAFALPLALAAQGGAPDWIQVFPNGGALAASDGRRWQLADPAVVAAASLAPGIDLAVDWEHAQDHKAPKGEPAPAAGWIDELQVRGDTIFAHVRWSETGKRSVEAREYRYFSPAFVVDRANKVLRLLGGALVNRPAFPQLPALAGDHTNEDPMEFMQKIRAALGLPEDADEAAIIAACEKLKGGAATAQAQAVAGAIAPIAKAAGLKQDADATAVLAAVTTLAAAGGDASKAIVGLQTELATVTQSLNEVKSAQARHRAEAFVDAEIKVGRVGVKPMREHYIARHMIDAASVEKEIAALPVLGPSGAHAVPPADKDGKIVLTAEQLTAAKVLGIDPEKYKQTLQAEAAARAA